MCQNKGPAMRPNKGPAMRSNKGPGMRPATAPSYCRPGRRDDGRDRSGGLARGLQRAPAVGPALSSALEGRGTTRPRDRFWMARALGALVRWWGWIEPLHMKRVEEQLLLAWLLDSVEVGPMAKVWAARIGRHPDRLVPVGDAPNWTGRAEGLKRWTEGRAVNADPWRLFPAWLRDQLPVPPGDATPKVQEARLPGRAPGAAVALGRGARQRTKSRSGPS